MWFIIETSDNSGHPDKEREMLCPRESEWDVSDPLAVLSRRMESKWISDGFVLTPPSTVWLGLSDWMWENWSISICASTAIFSILLNSWSWFPFESKSIFTGASLPLCAVLWLNSSGRKHLFFLSISSKIVGELINSSVSPWEQNGEVRYFFKGRLNFSLESYFEDWPMM